MRIAVFGLGYVGLVTAACLAEWDHDVVGVDASAARRKALDAGELPFHEPGLADLVARHRAGGRLRFAADGEGDVVASALKEADAVVVAVGTHDGNGGWQTTTMLACLGQVVPAMRDDAVLVIRSTLPPEFVNRLRSVVAELRGTRRPISTVLNPEFTREGTAIADFLGPERVVIGIVDDADGSGERRARDLYAKVEAPILTMSAIDAGFSKLGANLFLATKISFANELARLCALYGADVGSVVEAMAFDARIGGAFLRPGVGFGGSCLPHQVTMTTEAAARSGVDIPLLAAVDAVNHRQRETFVELLALGLDGSLVGRRVALLGLSFKPDTDDLRDAPALTIARRLLTLGAQPVAYDPLAVTRDRAAALIEGLEVVESVDAAVEGADAIGLVTEWAEFSSIDWTVVKEAMRGRVVVDGRNALDVQRVLDAGLAYYGFGRRVVDQPPSVKSTAPEPAARNVQDVTDRIEVPA